MVTAPGGQAPIRAHTFITLFPTFSKPVVLACDDGKVYVVKGLQPGRPDHHQMSRAIIADHVVGRVGYAMGAPVPEIRLIDVPAALRDAQPEMQHMVAGIAHGSLR